MGRPWEYSRMRRIAMQVAMWVTLGATLGLAQFIVYSRGHAAVVLGPPKSWGDLEVRLPEDWPVVVAGDDVLEVRSDKDQVAVALEIGPRAAGAGEQSAGKTEPISFSGLKRTGTLNTESQLLRGGNRQMEDRVQLLTARVALDATRELAIQVQDRVPRAVPADRALLKQIAGSVTAAQGSAPQPIASDNPAEMRVSLHAIRIDKMQQGGATIFTLSNAPPRGSATIVLRGTAPRKIVLRLSGFDRLDSFTVSNDRYKVECGDQFDPPQVQRLGDDGQWIRVPFAPRFQMIPEQKPDSVEIVLPPVLYTGNLSPLLVKWEQATQ